MKSESELYDEYYKMSGQDFQYLMSGASQFGPGKITDLVKECIKDKKKIVWVPDLRDGEDVGLSTYELQAL